MILVYTSNKTNTNDRKITYYETVCIFKYTHGICCENVVLATNNWKRVVRRK